MMTRLLPVSLLAALAVLLVALAGTAQAIFAITHFDTYWTQFFHQPPAGGKTEFAVTLGAPGCALIVDATCTGDRFQVTINRQDKGATRYELHPTAATAACAAQGMVLAGVTSANWEQVLGVVRASPGINVNPTDAVIVDSWNTDTYGGVDLQLTVSGTGDAVTLVTAPAYPLCATP
ncbi:hypothetical protein AMAG_14098 [Allomyces macrogynus ATCC 38327]|uniref:Uncharacterized protein n=1 Tax=Allomyces macrogynus (strain ATCC 38327) TaxID=578462 RepID=A0A0L0T402_ALLM3|nr:hypothetical protein AMAG_14098 [Allomyces macrogynus ATCC 38327]|eukprot:KNE69533.1 hypothetical protein AMAG_14098 [Allomyces macrogynus ATCC 38327]